MKKVLLLGNGLNRLNRNYSWEDLIQDLLAWITHPAPPSVRGKPFPLLYEELVQAAFRIGHKETALKEKLAELVDGIKGSSLHAELAKLPVGDILTTNYDYNIENAWTGKVKTEEVTETKYSFFRRKSLNGRRIWHIHGERDRPESIMLGYEQYSGYLQNMRDYVQKGQPAKKLKSVEERVKRGIGSEVHSWVDCFFNRNVYILGLRMDFVEMHLWWLITYRARLRQLEGYEIGNKITYIYPSFDAAAIQPLLQLLLGMEIHLQIIQVRKGAWQAFYKKALASI